MGANSLMTRRDTPCGRLAKVEEIRIRDDVRIYLRPSCYTRSTVSFAEPLVYNTKQSGTIGEVADKSRRAAGIPRELPGQASGSGGSARATPPVRRDMTSFVHDYLAATKQRTSFDDNRPMSVRCVHPLVRLVEKLDALHQSVPREEAAPTTFVRHFEDAARVIHGSAKLPPLPDYASVRV